jgi:hypothetical protein
MQANLSGASKKKMESIPKVEERSPMTKPKSVEKVLTRHGYISIYRLKGSDEWTIQGTMVLRNSEQSIQSIPPSAEEAMTIELELPFENK